MLDFADKHLLSKRVEGDFFRFPNEAELDAAAAAEAAKQPSR